MSAAALAPPRATQQPNPPSPRRQHHSSEQRSLFQCPAGLAVLLTTDTALSPLPSRPLPPLSVSTTRSSIPHPSLHFALHSTVLAPC